MTKIIQIKNNRPRIYEANGVSLVPGLNRLSQLEAEKFLKHPHIAIKKARGFIEILGEVADEVLAIAEELTSVEPTEPEVEEPEVEEFEEPVYGIKGLNAEDSITKIKIIEDVEYLKVVAAREERKTVAIAAEKRVEELENPEG